MFSRWIFERVKALLGLIVLTVMSFGNPKLITININQFIEKLFRYNWKNNFF